MRIYFHYLTNYFRSFLRTPPKTLLKIVNYFPKLISIFSSFLRFDIPRYLAANSFEYEETTDPIESRIGILLLAHNKDFDSLPYALNFGFRATSNFQFQHPYLIVPDTDLSRAHQIKDSLTFPLDISTDESYLSPLELTRIKMNFGTRSGWVIQQLLKIKFLMQTNEENVLIIDADTILLHRRNWFDSSGRQLLMPSEELTPQYYDFLSHKGLEINRNLSFITHHMLIQVKYFKESLERIGLGSFEDLLDFINEYSILENNSPFSLDYELYGQYMLNYHPEKITLKKWSNISISKAKIFTKEDDLKVLEKLSKKYASVSMHSWL